MKAFITLLALLFTLPVHAGTMQTNNVWQFGGWSTTAGPNVTIPAGNSGGMQVLYGGSATATNADFYAFHDGINAGAFKVSGGAFKGTTLCYYANHAAGDPMQTVTGTAAILSEGTATPPTGVVYGGGATGVYPILSTSLTSYTCYYAPFCWANNLYPAVQSGIGAGSTTIGFYAIGQVISGATCP